MNNIKERIKIFSGAQLKYIAFLSMFIDHTNKASPTVIPYDEFEQYKEKLPYYRNIVKEGRKIG